MKYIKLIAKVGMTLSYIAVLAGYPIHGFIAFVLFTMISSFIPCANCEAVHISKGLEISLPGAVMIWQISMFIGVVAVSVAAFGMLEGWSWITAMVASTALSVLCSTVLIVHVKLTHNAGNPIA